jgi:hypothetical protein
MHPFKMFWNGISKSDHILSEVIGAWPGQTRNRSSIPGWVKYFFCFAKCPDRPSAPPPAALRFALGLTTHLHVLQG